MAGANKRRSTRQNSRDIEDERETQEYEPMRINPNAKILKAKRRSMSTSNTPPNTVLLKGLNKSFLQTLTQIYSQNNTYDMSKIFSQYNKHKESIGRTEPPEELFKGSIGLKEVLRSGHSIGQSIRGLEGLSSPLGGVWGSVGGSTRGSMGSSSTNDTSSTSNSKDSVDGVDSIDRGGRRSASTSTTGVGLSNTETKGTTETEPSASTPITTGTKPEPKSESKPTTKTKPECTTGSESKPKPTPPHSTKPTHTSTTPTPSKTPHTTQQPPNKLFDLSCKVFIRKSKRFEDLGFHRVIVEEKNKEKELIIYQNKKELVRTLIDKSSIRSEPNTKELAFVDSSTAILYKVKLATLKDSDGLRGACQVSGV